MRFWAILRDAQRNIQHSHAAGSGWLNAITRDRNRPQKPVWRARIIVLTADGTGTTAIARAVGTAKTTVWRWQERCMPVGVAGLTRDQTRPSRLPPLPAETIDRVVALTHPTPPHEATHGTAPAMAKGGISPSLVRHREGSRPPAASGAPLQARQRSQLG